VTTQANFVPATGTTPASATALTTYNGTSTATTGNNTSTTNVGTTGNTASNLVNNLIGLTNTGTTNRLTSAVFSASDFNIIVSALKTQNNAKVVSNPTVVTLNNSEAVLNIGSEFPIPSYTYNSERGTFEVSGFQYKPIGVILKVTPQVNARGVVKLTLEPEISQQADSTSFGGAGGASIPIISTRKVKTQVSLASGQTVGIGGLISTTKSHSGTKVPILGDIPGLGRLFSSKNINDNETNLLIFVTAKVIDAEGATPEAIFNASALDAVQMADAAMDENKGAKKKKAK
jgi:type IV pilus assembly protein PilQ